MRIGWRKRTRQIKRVQALATSVICKLGSTKGEVSKHFHLAPRQGRPKANREGKFEGLSAAGNWTGANTSAKPRKKTNYYKA